MAHYESLEFLADIKGKIRRSQEVPLIAPVITRLALYCTASSFLLKGSLTDLSYKISM